MALIRTFERKHMDRNSIHDQIDASYTVFENDGRVFVQIDSYGRDERAIPGKKSKQSSWIAKALLLSTRF